MRTYVKTRTDPIKPGGSFLMYKINMQKRGVFMVKREFFIGRMWEVKSMKRFLKINFGVLIMAIGLYVFLIPENLAAGGVTGK